MNWEQFKAIVWLRWRLSRNQFVKAGPLNAVLSAIGVAMLACGAVAAAVGGVAGGFAAATAPPHLLMPLIVWDAVVFLFLIIWGTGLLAEIQRSESIDLPKLLHLPVTLRQVFVFNYVASLASPSLVLFLPGMLGLCVGQALALGFGMILTAPVVFGLLFFVTAWTYCLRGWLAALMVNQRRRRSIVVWVTVLFVLAGQLPNLIFNSPFFRRATRAGHSHSAPGGAAKGMLAQDTAWLPPRVLEAHCLLPPGWPAYDTLALKNHNPWPAVAATVAGCLMGALGLARSYQMTLRFYTGAGERRIPRAPQSEPAPGPRTHRRLMVERDLPGVPREAAALALATFQSLLRAPELKMAFIMPVVMAILGLSAFFARPQHAIPAVLTGFVASAAVGFAVFSMAPAMSNVFGLDRNGFRALVLLAVRRHYVLLAKNLAFLPFACLVALVLLTIATVLLSIPWDQFLTALIQVPTVFLIFSLLCNFAAILAPYRLAPGTLQARKPKAIVFVTMLVNLLVLPFVMPVIGLPPGLQWLFSSQGWLAWLPVNLISAALVLAGVAWVYRIVLPLQGRLLQRRELAILLEVTEEVE